MAKPTRLHEELLNWFVSAGLVVPIVFLIHLLPILSSMSRLPPTENQLDLFFLYGGPIGDTIVVGGITIFLALAWHMPRILGANAVQKNRWADRGTANLIFWIAALVAAILTRIASYQCLFQIEYRVHNPSEVQFGFMEALLCQPDPKFTIPTVVIWFGLFAFSVAYGIRIAWISWNSKKVYQ